MIDIQTANNLLEVLWSNQDPVFINGKETTICDFASEEETGIDSRFVRVDYYGKDHKLVKGTLSGMIKERLQSSWSD